MAFQLSPGVDVNEIDLTTLIPSVSSTRAGFAGSFQWGPVGQRITITSENELFDRFQGPNSINYAYWFTASNYLGYGNNLQVVRVVDRDNSKNAGTSGGFGIVLNSEDYDDKQSSLATGSQDFVARYPGKLGNSLLVSVSDRTHTTLKTVFSNTATGITNMQFATDNSSTTFFHDSEQPQVAVAGKDLVRFGFGTPKTIAGFTSSYHAPVGHGLLLKGNTAGGYIEVGTSAGAQIIHVYPSGGTTGVSTKVSDVIHVGDRFQLPLGSGVTGIATVTSVTTSGGSNGISMGIGAGGFGGLAAATLGNADIAQRAAGRLGAFSVGTTFSNAGATVCEVLWQYYDQFSQKLPATSTYATTKGSTFDVLHAIVVDEDGDWTGTKGTVLERFEAMSKAPNAVNFDKTTAFYKTIINETSKYLWWGDHPNVTFTGGAAWGTELDASSGITFQQLAGNYYASLTGGSASGPAGDDYFTDGFDQFADTETVDISLLLGGPQGGVKAGSIVDLCDKRKDCVCFLSPPESAVLNTGTKTPKSAAVATANVSAYRNGVNGSDAGGDVNFTSGNLNKSSSYAFMDNGWKYMYDRYNDVFRFVPLNGDIAGIAARSDEATEPWFSPAGFNRGQVRGVVKLAYNPVKAQRDNLYQDGINPVVSFPGEGTVLFGDKTLQSKPSAFDRINVRRLFIVLEKAIATAAKFQLFEQNDAFTRASFRQMIEPFLRDVQSKRGITDYKVVCDETNNTGEIIDRNEFVADIFIKPTRSINFISLNFIATRTGVDFDEIGGAN
jgi:hypothetical protein